MKFQNCGAETLQSACGSAAKRGDAAIDTHDPPCALAVRELLRVGPLVQERVGRVELGREAPFAEPERAVAERGVGLHALEVCERDGG